MPAGITPTEYFQTDSNHAYNYHTTHQGPTEPHTYNTTDDNSIASNNATSQYYSFNTSSMRPTSSTSTTGLGSHLAIQGTLYHTPDPQYQNSLLQAGYNATSQKNDIVGIGAQFGSQMYPKYDQPLYIEEEVQTEE